MEIVYLIIGILIGCIIGYVIAARKSEALRTKLELEQTHAAENLKAVQERFSARIEELKQEIDGLQKQMQEYIKQLNEAERNNASLMVEKKATEEKMNNQKEEITALHKQFNLEFEAIAEKIFRQKTEHFNKLSAESLSNILTPFKENLNELKHQVAETYDKESKQRFSLEDKIKELVQLNKQISDEANNLTRALKGDAKTQGNWGEMILETILENSGLREGEEFFRQEQVAEAQAPVRVEASRVHRPENARPRDGV